MVVRQRKTPRAFWIAPDVFVSLALVIAAVMLWQWLRRRIRHAGRARFQFRLRTLLIAVAIVGIALARYMVWRKELNTEKENRTRNCSERDNLVPARVAAGVARQAWNRFKRFRANHLLFARSSRRKCRIVRGGNFQASRVFVFAGAAAHRVPVHRCRIGAAGRIAAALRVGTPRCRYLGYHAGPNREAFEPHGASRFVAIT